MADEPSGEGTVPRAGGEEEEESGPTPAAQIVDLGLSQEEHNIAIDYIIEITSCKSRSLIQKLLRAENWDQEAAIDAYFKLPKAIIDKYEKLAADGEQEDSKLDTAGEKAQEGDEITNDEALCAALWRADGEEEDKSGPATVGQGVASGLSEKKRDGIIDHIIEITACKSRRLVQKLLHSQNWDSEATINAYFNLSQAIIDKYEKSAANDERADAKSDTASEKAEGEEEPSNAQAEEAIRQFCETTGRDEALAHSILQDVNWSVERALDVFFSWNQEEMAVDEAPEEDRVGAGRDVVVGAGASVKPTESSFEIRVLTWNVDGLDLSSLATRMKAVHLVVTSVNPDFIFLQEVTDEVLAMLNKFSGQYDVHIAEKFEHYYTIICTPKVFEVTNEETIPFPQSKFGRSLQIVEGTLGEFKIFLLTTHLESMRENAPERKKQLGHVMDKVNEIITSNPKCYLFLGGDFNLRDEEEGVLPVRLRDVWKDVGEPAGKRFTWDPKKNSNKNLPFARGMRFDRLYYYAQKMRVKEMDLAGTQTIRSVLCHPSDHFAISAVFNEMIPLED